MIVINIDHVFNLICFLFVMSYLVSLFICTPLSLFSVGGQYHAQTHTHKHTHTHTSLLPFGILCHAHMTAMLLG